MSIPLFTKKIVARFTDYRHVMKDPEHIDPDNIVAKVSCGKDIYVVTPADLAVHEGCYVTVTFEFGVGGPKPV